MNKNSETMQLKKINVQQKEVASRIVIVWTNITNYVAASIKELVAQGCQLLIVQIKSDIKGNTTFRFNNVPNVEFINFVDITEKKKNVYITNRIKLFKPDYVLISFNNRGIYYDISKQCKRSSIPVVAASDGYYEHSFRQLFRIVLSRFGFHKNYDAIFVPGYLAVQFARQLNFVENKIIQGLYSCDDKLFRKVGIIRHQSNAENWPHVFLFNGQLIHRKGFDVLLNAYKLYRDKVKDPWELWIIGDGPLRNLVKDIKGISYLGPLNAEECTEKYASAGCFVLPSVIDHWPLVIHEATCSGLPVIASSSCGSTVELLQPFHNGILISHSDENDLTQAMIYLSSEDDLAREMGKNSLSMSWRYSSATWAKKVMHEIPRVIHL